MDSQTFKQVISIAQHAGAKIMEIYRGDIEVSLKADESPVTAADLAAHHYILAALERLTPDIPVLSEEDLITWDVRQTWSRYWLVDPLDGTKEFINKRDEFTVNIALIENHVPTAGVVYVPVKDITYWGIQGQGAFKNNTAITCTSQTPQPLRVCGSRSHRNPATEAFYAQLPHHELVSVGSSLKFCLVAEGLADFYPRVGLTSEWDTAAGQAVVEAAGGQVVTADGLPLAYNHKADILNPHFYVYATAELQRLIRPATA